MAQVLSLPAPVYSEKKNEGLRAVALRLLPCPSPSDLGSRVGEVLFAVAASLRLPALAVSTIALGPLEVFPGLFLTVTH